MVYRHVSREFCNPDDSRLLSLLIFLISYSYMISNFTSLIFSYLLQLPVADPFLEKVSLSDLGKYLNNYYEREKEMK